jgi:hypothetical protein
MCRLSNQILIKKQYILKQVVIFFEHISKDNGKFSGAPRGINPPSVRDRVCWNVWCTPGKGDLARGGLKEAGVQVSVDSETMGRRTEIAYKAESPGKSAPHGKAQDSGDTVNAAVV